MDAPQNSSYEKACPECGGKVFHAIPGETTDQEVRKFQAELERTKGVSNGDPGWVHPGAYCYDCNWGVMAHYPPEGSHSVKFDNRPARLVLDAAGSDVTRVAAAIKRGTGMTSSAALRAARDAPVIVLRRPAARIWQLENVQTAIMDAGGSAHITQESEQVVADQRE